MSSATGFTIEQKASLNQYLETQHVPPTAEWLSGCLSTIRANTPLPALQKSVLFRLLATDLVSSVRSAQASVFPSDITNPSIEQRQLNGPVVVQVLDIEDIGRSRWSQVEAIEAYERGETTKGREIIRSIPETGGAGDGDCGGSTAATTTTTSAQPSQKSAGPHKLLLQDAKGTKAYAFEVEPIAGFGVRMAIGSKLVLRNTAVARGVVLMEPGNVEILGGKVEVWDKKWRSERKEVLKRMAGG